MPLPLLLIGAAVLTGVYGVKKGVDAKSDYDSAKNWNNRAQELYDEAQEELKQARELTQYSMEKLGQTKFLIFDQSLLPFVHEFKKIRDFDYGSESIDAIDHFGASEPDDFKMIENTALQMQDVVGGGLASLGAGGLAGLAAYGGVGMLGTASTGTAIGTLSGAAATNATLAWLGGGSLASGGLGMAGGMAVLGGIVAGPVLAVGGMMIASKAEEAKHNAYANYDRAELAAEEMGLAKVAVQGINQRFDEINTVLTKLNETFVPLLGGLKALVEHESNRLLAARSAEGQSAIVMINETLEAAEAYQQSSLGVFNKIRFLFLKNTALEKLEDKLQALKIKIEEDSFQEVFQGLGVFSVEKNQTEKLVETLVQTRQSVKNKMENGEVSAICFHRLSQQNQKGLHMTYNLAQTLHNLVQAKIIDDEGVLTDESRKSVENGEAAVDYLLEHKPVISV